MATIIIGGEKIDVDLPNIKALKRAWKHLAAARASANIMDNVDSILAVVVIGRTDLKQLPKDATDDDITARIELLEEAMKPAELVGMNPFLNELMIQIGLAKRPDPGEAAPAEGETASPSTAISTP